MFLTAKYNRIEVETSKYILDVKDTIIAMYNTQSVKPETYQPAEKAANLFERLENILQNK